MDKEDVVLSTMEYYSGIKKLCCLQEKIELEIIMLNRIIWQDSDKCHTLPLT
jgi:hypothetical protein